MHTNGCGRADTGRNRSCWPVIPRVVTLRSRLRSGCSATTRNRRQLLQLAKGPKQDHPNIGTDAMFPARAFDALAAWVRAAAAKNMVDGRPEDLYEPLDHIESSLPPTLIHVSGSEVLLHDAQLGAGKLAAAGVCAEVRVWPGQAHLFQLATPLVPEATRSLRQIGQFIRDATADSSLSPVHRSRYVAGSPRAASRGAFGQSPI